MFRLGSKRVMQLYTLPKSLTFVVGYAAMGIQVSGLDLMGY
jgi:hypothetical protein